MVNKQPFVAKGQHQTVGNFKKIVMSLKYNLLKLLIFTLKLLNTFVKRVLTQTHTHTHILSNSNLAKATSWAQVHLVKIWHHPTEGGSQLITGALIRLSLIKGGEFQTCLRCYNVLGTCDLNSLASPTLRRFFSNAHH